MQDDINSRKIAFSIYAGGAQWAVPDGTLVTVRYKKPDGTAGFYDTPPDGVTPAATIDGNVVTVALVPQALRCAEMCRYKSSCTIVQAPASRRLRS